MVSPDELQRDYAPNAADRDKLVKWLKTQGFDVTGVSHDGTSVYARASVEQIEKSLAVDMVRVTKDGVTYTAAKNAPSLPSDVATGVHAIIGLQPFRQARKQSRMCMPHNGNRASLNGAPPQAGTAARGRRGARDRNRQRAAVHRAGDPQGVRRGRIGRDRERPDDRDSHRHLPGRFGPEGVLGATTACRLRRTRVEKVNVKGGPLPPPTGEETLDVEWASGIAPGAKVRVYASGTLQFVDLDRALDRIIADLPSHPGMRQLSISLGLGEKFMGGPNGEVRTQHHKFLLLAAAGVNVFVSSGDAGSKPDDSGHSATGPTQAEYESSDSTVVGVGGTTLKLTPAGAVKSEVGWASSGGGKSIFFARPAWQTGKGVPAGRKRLVPDVSLAADPSTGAFLVLNGTVVQMGGTSWSAPVWAGFCALLNEARSKARKPFLPFLNPLLYPLQGTACFRDIRAGNNGDFSAGPGYDLVTGLGVPNVKELMKALT